MSKFFILALVGLFASLSSLANNTELIRIKTEELAAGRKVVIHGEPLYCSITLPGFYQSKNFTPVWKETDLRAFVTFLETATDNGLNPQDYHHLLIKEMVNKAVSDAQQAELDLLMTDAFLLYASHLLSGKTSAKTYESQWKATRRGGDVLEVLNTVLQTRNFREALRTLEPQDPSYNLLKEKLSAYRNEKTTMNELTLIPSGLTLKPGMKDRKRITILASRLRYFGYLEGSSGGDSVYTNSLAETVRNYQRQNGLEADGNVGPKTLASLNIQPDARIKQIKVNLERHRWVPEDKGTHHILVNIPAYEMQVFKDGRETYRENIVVGKPVRETPVFSGKMTYFVLNPYWTIPPTILFNDILPEQQKNRGYLASKNIKVFSGNTEVPAASVNWSTLSRSNFPYTLRQEPGPVNALGVVKFMFPNTYNIYLHDTPSRELFNRAERAFSSGCIRLRNPLDFAAYLVQEDPTWTQEKMDKLVDTKTQQTVMLKKPLAVHLLYFTAWGENKTLQFREDIYARDEKLYQALTDSYGPVEPR